MPVLIVRLLGGFSARWDGDSSALAFDSDKTRALLVYLAMAGGKEHRRELLAGLLWPDMPEHRARANLSQAIYSLRRHIAQPDLPDLLVGDRQTVMLNPDFDLNIDAVAFAEALAAANQHKHKSLSHCKTCQSALAEATALYGGSFLEGFSLPVCAEYEEWMALQRERLQRDAVEALRHLVACHESAGEIETALAYARRWAALAPWQEAAHQRVMRLLALAGNRSEALAYFETCERMLRQELGVEPRDSTRWLVADIRAGRIRATDAETAIQYPDFLAEMPPNMSAPPLFVGREPQLSVLEESLNAALAGEGRMLFVAGEAGSGKTALLGELAAQAQFQSPDLLTVWGQCNAFAGSGDPYLPIRQALGQLTGEVQQGYEAGRLDAAQARRLWSALPLAIDALLAHAPELIDVFLPGTDLIMRASQAAEGDPGWLTALRKSMEAGQSGKPGLRNRQLHEQTIAFLRDLSVRRPLLLIIDDLHWVDVDTASLLFHLARSLADMHLFIVGAFRQEEMDAGQEGGLHPLKTLLAECKRLSGVTPINLNRLPESERRDWLDRLLDAERNDLDARFRQILFERTEGHALFTVETLHDLQACGVLVWDEDHGWVQHQPGWGGMPARAEGVIEARVARLSPDLRALLEVASVEGDVFSAQTLASALGRDLYMVVSQLSSELDRKHRLAAEVGIGRLGGEPFERFRFRHSLFRQHVYEGMGEADRRHWHGRVGAILEVQHGERAREIAPQLARHFMLAGEREKAVVYWLQCGDAARTLFAFGQAEEAYRQALALAREANDYEQTAHILMRLGLTQHNAGEYDRAQEMYAEGFRLWSQFSAGTEVQMPPAARPLRLVWGLAPRNTDPTLDFVSDLFSGLVAETVDREIVPDVAHRWEIGDAGRRYTFHLRDDVRWSDGEPLTAHDFAFAWQHNRLPSPGQPLYDVRRGKVLDFGITADLQQLRVETPDPHTLIVHIAQPAVYFLHLLATPLAAPKPRHIVERYGDAWAAPQHIVCNGPFLLDHWDTATDRLYFARNPRYLGSYGGNVDHVEAIYPRQPTDWQSLLDLYEQDEIDCQQIMNWGGQGVYAAKRRHPYEYVQAPLAAVTLFCYDTHRPPFDDVRVRRAFAMALDRSEVAGAVRPETDILAYGGLLPPGMPGHSPKLCLPFDPDRARRLLAEAGYPDGSGFPEVKLAVFFTPSTRQVAELLQMQYGRHLGVSVQAEILEWTAYWRAVQQNRPHMTLMSAAGNYGDPDAVMRQGFRTVQKLTGWSDDVYEHLIAQAGHTTNQDERIDLYRRADAILVEQAVILPLVYQEQAWLVKPWISRFPLSLMSIGAAWKDIVINAESHPVNKVGL
ncbi:MAG: AAA family ATPase [Caldilineales bacterium]|nr:AAA family ATPase [Caldilineales bacterium]